MKNNYRRDDSEPGWGDKLRDDVLMVAAATGIFMVICGILSTICR